MLHTGLDETARSMHDNLTFIGAKEYVEAAASFAANWRQKLTEDPKVQLCIPLDLIDGGLEMKSNVYLLDAVLQNFTDTELAQWRGRLVTRLDAITASPKDVNVILIDDWIISGKQMAQAAFRLSKTHPEYLDRTEIQLITATEARLEDGVGFMAYNPSREFEAEREYRSVPVSAYYRTHIGSTPDMWTEAHETGAHCSSDYGFNIDVSTMATF